MLPSPIHARFITGARLPEGSGPGTPPPPPPPPPPTATCSRIATNQRGEIASIIEPTMLPDDLVHGATSGTQGLFVAYAYEQFGIGNPGLTWTYNVNEPNTAWEPEQQNTIWIGTPTWSGGASASSDVQKRIDEATAGTWIKISGSTPDQIQPLVVSNKNEIVIDFGSKPNCFYAGGDSTGAILTLTNCTKVTILGFRCTCSAGNRRRGVKVDNCSDIEFRSPLGGNRSRVFGCTDGIVFENGSGNERIRFKDFDSLANTQPGFSTDYGYGAYLDDATDLTLDNCYFEAGDGSGEHALRIPYPTRLKIIDCTTRVSLASAQKRCLWIFGGQQVQITNFTAINQRCDIGLTQGSAGSGSGSDNQGGGSTRQVRIDGFTSNNCQYANCLNFRCGGYGVDGSQGTGFVADAAVRNAQFNNPANPGRAIQVEWRDRFDASSDINWLPDTCTVNGSTMMSSNWNISSDWSSAEAVARGIGPLLGSTAQYQQYIILRSAPITFISDEVLEMDGVSNPAYKSRSAANGGVSQTQVKCATGQSSASIAAFGAGGFGDAFVARTAGDYSTEPTFRFDLRDDTGEINVAFYNGLMDAVPGVKVIRGLTSGATGQFVRFEPPEDAIPFIVLSNIVGQFLPGERLECTPSFDSIGIPIADELRVYVGNPTNAVATS